MRGEQPGIMHALVFWGFLVLMGQAVAPFGRAFGRAICSGRRSSSCATCTSSLIVGAGYMLDRRLFVHPPRLVGLGRCRAALPRGAASGGDPDPGLHRADHDRRAALRRGAPRRVRHPGQRARLRGGRLSARRAQRVRGADRQPGWLVSTRPRWTERALLISESTTPRITATTAGGPSAVPATQASGAPAQATPPSCSSTTTCTSVKPARSVAESHDGAGAGCSHRRAA